MKILSSIILKQMKHIIGFILIFVLFTHYFEIQDLLENNKGNGLNEVNVDDNIWLLRDNYDEDCTDDNYENEMAVDREDCIDQNIMDSIVDRCYLLKFTQIITSIVEVIHIFYTTLRIILLVILISFAIDHGGKETSKCWSVIMRVFCKLYCR